MSKRIVPYEEEIKKSLNYENHMKNDEQTHWENVCLFD